MPLCLVRVQDTYTFRENVKFWGGTSGGKRSRRWRTSLTRSLSHRLYSGTLAGMPQYDVVPRCPICVENLGKYGGPTTLPCGNLQPSQLKTAVHFHQRGQELKDAQINRGKRPTAPLPPLGKTKPRNRRWLQGTTTASSAWPLSRIAIRNAPCAVPPSLPPSL